MAETFPSRELPSVAILGAGLLGSVLALRLQRAGHRVTLLESAPAIGGLTGAAASAGFIRDRYYHVVLLSDLNTRRLIDELRLTDKLHWGTTRTGFFTDGQLHSMSNALEFLRFKPLALPDKLRLAATIIHASRIKDPAPLESVRALDWLERLSGRRVVDRIWRPLLRSKLGDNARIASAAFIWAIIARMYAARRSGIKREMFGYLDGGYAGVLDALGAELRLAGVRLEHGFEAGEIATCDQPKSDRAAVDRMSDDPARTSDARSAQVRVKARDGRQVMADHVIATVSPRILLRIVPGLTETERERLASVQMQGVVCVAVLTRHPLSPYYVTNITEPGIPFTGVIEMTALADRAQFGGHSLVYLPFYLAQDDPRWKDDDATFIETVCRGLERMYPAFDRNDLVDVSVARSRDVLAISTLGYSERSMPALQSSVPGLMVLNSAQIAYGTLNVNETLGLIETHWREIRTAMGVNDDGASANAFASATHTPLQSDRPRPDLATDPAP